MRQEAYREITPAAVDGLAPEARASLKKAVELLPDAQMTARKYA